MNRETCFRCDSHKIYRLGLCYECWERIYKTEDLSPEELRELEDTLNKQYDNMLKATHLSGMMSFYLAQDMARFINSRDMDWIKRFKIGRFG
ncbi:MAG: hypothetical protein DDT26_02231 [Dehalococcoidia bacterium]|nr:hypothetical protein [Chloroflexota bacterium]